ncbi:MAG: hypothetical protein PHP88_06660 [bacterium]|nr:hypothetical protein [bacterium]
MPYSTHAKNYMLDQFRANKALYASLHTASPGDNGANEVAGGSPAYARKSIAWGAASGGVITATNQPVFDVPAGTTVAFVGFWDALTAGNFVGSADVTDEVFAGQGTYTLTSATDNLNL